MDAPQKGNGKRWVELMRERNPRHARLYCDHGEYIGSNGLFRDKCEECNPPKET